MTEICEGLIHQTLTGGICLRTSGGLGRGRRGTAQGIYIEDVSPIKILVLKDNYAVSKSRCCHRACIDVKELALGITEPLYDTGVVTFIF